MSSLLPKTSEAEFYEGRLCMILQKMSFNVVFTIACF